MNFINRKFWNFLSIIIWAAFLIIAGTTYYVNNYFPHGPSYDAGDVICQDYNGRCSEEHYEDLRHVNMPKWAKLFREHNGNAPIGLCIFLALAGIMSNYKAKEDA